jgi:NTE family protein
MMMATMSVDALAAQTTGAPTVADSVRRVGGTPEREAIVLSGGGSRGLAHVGTLLGLEELGYDPDLVVGTSIGALAGALYASGRSPAEIQDSIRAINWGDVFTPAPLVLGPDREARYPLLTYDRESNPLRFNRGFIPQWRINRVLVRLLFDAEARSRGDFDRLARPYRAVATDLQTGRSVVLARGDLARAARASMAVPGVFSPVEWEGRSLVDGGLSSNLPTDVARQLGATRIIAVDVGRPSEEILGRGPLQVASRALDILEQNAEQSTVQPDLLIVPPLDPNSLGITFPADPDPLFRIGLAGVQGVPAASRRRPEPRPLAPPPAAFGGLVIEAPDSATAALARRVFRHVAPGPYDPMRVLAAVDRLYTTGLFEGVWPRVEDSGGTDAAPALIVRLERPPLITIAGGAGFDTDRGGRLWAALQRSQALMGAPAVLTGTLSLDRLRQWGSAGAQIHLAQISPLVATAGLFRRETDLPRDGDLRGDDEVRRTGAWAGIDFQQLLAQRVASAVVRAEHIRVDGGRDGFIVGPLLRLAAPTADPPVVGVPFLAEAEVRMGAVEYSRASLRASRSTRLGLVRLAAVGDFAAASAGAPADVHASLGEEHAMPGVRWGERRAPVRALAGADAAYPLASGAYMRTRLRAGAVADRVGSLENRDRWMSGADLGVVYATPFGVFNLAFGANSRGEQRLILDLGAQF